MALLHIKDAGGRQWQHTLSPQSVCTIGRAPDNQIVLNDGRASRYHAHIKFRRDAYFIFDGVVEGSAIKRSANKVFVNGRARGEHPLADGDQINIGTSVLRFQLGETPPQVRYDEGRLGRTQLTISAGEVVWAALRQASPASAAAASLEEVGALRRKAGILALLYEMSKTLNSVFDLDAVFRQATDIIFRVTPADRVVALLCDAPDASADPDASLRPVATRMRDERLAGRAGSDTIGRTITRKVMRERVALLSQDAAAESQFAGVDSIIAQGVRSTICAPLVAESGVHGALYADRLDPGAVFTRDDLEFISAIASQAAMTVENVRAHERLAREEVARANYSRFLPEYVVRQMLEHPESFKLGGVNQTITVLFADVRGFTRLSEHAPPEQIVQLLNRYFTAMTDIIFAHGGTLDKYIGDGLMALFGAPTATPQDAANALAAAVSMQRQIETLNEELRAAGLPEIKVGIGLHTGEATVGYIGSERRSEYTAIGDTVNLASRLEANAQGGQILLSAAAAAAAPGGIYALNPRPALTVKNRTQPVPIFEVGWQR
jgi:adenylate cyclase